MKNALKKTIFVAAAVIFSAPVFADGLVFDPESYPVSANSSVVAQSSSSISNQTYSTTSPYVAAPAVNTKKVNDIQNSETRQNNNMQNALFELDSAQVDIRTQLIDARAQYTDIDNKYKMIREQRKIQRKTVKDAEKRIRQLEKTKNQIRKNMQIQ